MATRFEGLEEMIQRVDVYERRILWIIGRIAVYWQAVFEEYSKKEAPWQDRTSNARSGLHAFIEELSNDTVRLYLSHTMDYGIFLF